MVKASLEPVRDAPDHGSGRRLTALVRERFAPASPSAGRRCAVTVVRVWTMVMPSKERMQQVAQAQEVDLDQDGLW